ncbi:MAG: NAD-binding protein, partial [Pseudomonadales bacterium]|nr:NAD-binding protein [Pseudomonadales bacterium]
LGARLQLSELVTLGWPALLVLLVIQFVAQPLKVFASAIGSNLTWQEKLMISWIGPRGIIAAAVSALFALQLQNMGYENTSILVTLTFAVIIGTVVIQSLTAKRLAKILGVTDNGVRGILIVGANPVGRAIGKVLQENDFEVMLIDSHWPYLSEARMQGLQIFHGNPVSQLVDQKLDFVGYGSCFALSQNDELNVLAAQRYIPEFGSKQVYSLRKAASKKNPEKYAASEEMRGRLLFEEGVSYAKLASLIAQGAEVKSTVIREEFSIDDYLAMYSERAVPLLLLKASGKLVVVTEALTELIAPPGTTVISLVQPAKETKDTDDPKVEGKVAKDAKEDNASPDN